MPLDQRRQVFAKYGLSLFLVLTAIFVGTGLATSQPAAAALPAVELVRESAPIGEDMAVLQESKPLVTRAGAWQTWNDHIHLTQGQEKSRLVLTFTNGAEGRAKFTDLKVLLGRKPYATLKDFGGADVLSCSLTGKLTRGNTALAVQGFGPSGARLNWRVHIQRPVITAVKPSSAGPSEKMTIEGNGFSEHAGDTKVLVAGKPAKLVSSKSTELQLKLPAQVPSGSQDLLVSVNSVESKPFKVSVKSTPQITWVNMLAANPGNTVIISGSGFSAVPSENTVTVGKTPARVTAATTSSITFIIPDMHYPRWHVPITVTTNGVTSKSKASINLQQLIVPNEGIPMR
jgi:hypothetical protein